MSGIARLRQASRFETPIHPGNCGAVWIAEAHRVSCERFHHLRVRRPAFSSHLVPTIDFRLTRHSLTEVGAGRKAANRKDPRPDFSTQKRISWLANNCSLVGVYSRWGGGCHQGEAERELWRLEKKRLITTVTCATG